jgi:hypothetical protein
MKSSNIVAGVALVAVATATVLSASQDRGTLVVTALDRAEQNIHTAFDSQKPALRGWDPARDRSIVLQAADGVLERFAKRGFGVADAAKGLGWSWFWVRISPTTTVHEISVKDLETRAAELGKIVITSTPEKAEVAIDSRLIEDVTRAEVFAVEGGRVVRVAVEGLRPAEATCQVRADRTVYFVATLDPEASRAECK